MCLVSTLKVEPANANSHTARLRSSNMVLIDDLLRVALHQHFIYVYMNAMLYWIFCVLAFICVGLLCLVANKIAKILVKKNYI